MSGVAVGQLASRPIPVWWPGRLTPAGILISPDWDKGPVISVPSGIDIMEGGLLSFFHIFILFFSAAQKVQ